jgi:hypothetical protein
MNDNKTTKIKQKEGKKTNQETGRRRKTYQYLKNNKKGLGRSYKTRNLHDLISLTNKKLKNLRQPINFFENSNSGSSS